MPKENAGMILEQLSQSKMFRPEREAYWRWKQQQGMSSAEIVKQIFSVPSEENFVDARTASQISREEKKAGQQQEQDYSRKLIDILTGQMQGQPTVPQQGNMTPIGQNTVIPNAGQSLLSPQQFNLLDMLKQSMNQPGFSLGENPLEMLQENFPQMYGIQEEEDPIKREKLELEKGELKARQKYYEILAKGKETAAQREKRLAKEGQQKYRLKLEDLDIKKARLNLDNQKYMLALEKLDKANDFQSIRAINDIAKLIASGEVITDEIFAQAIEKLKTFNPRFNELHKRAVKKKKGWFGKETDKPTLKKPEEIDPFEDLF